ncbi:MAG TPA: hypothetical protein VFG76_05370, partial [Candidatus Polarisedimenticolia bacterium]|nr:hypothetical protein [Candidatus Polarisedimenticolia bacterium]
LIFEPALGPEALVFHPLEGAAAREWPAPAVAAVKEALASLPAPCAQCAAAGRFRWIPVEADAYFWPEDLLSGLSRGEIVPSDALCGACAAARLTRSLEERGLYLDAIVPPRGGDGVLLGSEI